MQIARKSRKCKLFGAVGSALVLSLLLATAAQARIVRHADATRPPGSIYTCPWIAAHPAAAAAALVTCSPNWVSLTNRPPVRRLTVTRGYSCDQIPYGGGKIGKGVFAWSNYYSSYEWYFQSLQITDNGDFTAYAQTQSGGNLWHSDSAYPGVADSTGALPPSIYRGGVQNHGTTAMNYDACRHF